MNPVVRTALTWLRDQLSSYNHWFKVGVIDGLLSMAATMLGAHVINAILDASLPQGSSSTLHYGELLVFAAGSGLVIGALSAWATSDVQQRSYLVRSIRLTIWATMVWILAPATLLWVVFSMGSTGDFEFAAWLSAVAFVAPLTAFLGYRSFAFTDPLCIAKLLRQGRESEAHALMAASAAARGLTWVPEEHQPA